MQKIFTLLAFFIVVGTVQLNAQCVPDTTIDTPGLYPNEFLIPCIERGVAYDQVIQIKNFGDVTVGPATLTVNWVRVERLDGLPTGFDWECVVADGDTSCQFNGLASACMRIFGTTNDPKGQYKIGIFVAASTSAGIFGEPIPVPVQTLSSALRYDFRVVNTGDTCPEVDTSILKDVDFGFSYFVGINELANDLVDVTMYPSPIKFEQTAFVSIVSEARHEVVGSIVDLMGRVVLTEEYTLNEGSNLKEISTSDLAPGSYVYNISNGLGTKSVKFIKVN